MGIVQNQVEALAWSIEAQKYLEAIRESVYMKDWKKKYKKFANWGKMWNQCHLSQEDWPTGVISCSWIEKMCT